MENVFTKKDPLLDVINQVVLGEKKLTDAELKKREEIAQAIERENPGMDMGKKMAIATAQAKKVAEAYAHDGDNFDYKDSERGAAGVIHPDKAKHYKVGEHAFFYDHGTGNRVAGKVMKKDSKQIHIKHIGKIKKFKISRTHTPQADDFDEEVEQIEEGRYLRYDGHVNGKHYSVHVPEHMSIGDYRHSSLHRKIAKENPHLHPHEVKAIVHSEGEEDSHVKVTHGGKTYTHHVYNEPEPDYVHESVEQIEEADEREVSDKLKRARDYEKVVNSRHNSRAHTKEIQVGVAKDMLDNAHKAVNKTAVAKFLKTRKGDGKVRTEEVEQIDELSKGTLGKYIGKAVVDVHNDAKWAGESGSKDASNKAFKRLLGVKSAAARLSKQNVSGGRISNYRSEEAEQIEEDNNNDLGDTHDDAYEAAKKVGIKPHSIGKHPKHPHLIRVAGENGKGVYNRKTKTFHKGIDEEVEQIDEISAELATKVQKAHAAKGIHHASTGNKSKSAEHITRAIHASIYAEKRKANPKAPINVSSKEMEHKANKLGLKTEDVEQIDELSRKTLSNYVKTASRSMHRDTMHGYLLKVPHDRPYADQRRVAKEKENHMQKSFKRLDGIHRAANKLAKEEVEQIDELSKGTLGKYISKAVVDVHNDAKWAGETDDRDAKNKAFKRLLGVKSAAARLSKQNVSGGRISNFRREEVEQIDEADAIYFGSRVAKKGLFGTKYGSAYPVTKIHHRVEWDNGKSSIHHGSELKPIKSTEKGYWDNKGGPPKNLKIKEEVNLEEQLENFWGAYLTCLDEAKDDASQQALLLRAMAKDPSDLMKMKRAIAMGDKALTNPVMRQEILKMLDQMMNLTVTDKALLQKTRSSFMKQKQFKAADTTNTEEYVLEEVEELDEANIPVHHVNKAVSKVLGTKGAVRFAMHHRPGTDKHTSWDKVNSALMKQGVKTKHIADIAAHLKPAQYNEEVEELDERNKENALRRKMMDASRGARWKIQNKMTADDVRDWDGKHKTNQAQNKAIGRALRNEEIEELDELSKDTLGNYIKKAATGMNGMAVHAHMSGSASSAEQREKHFDKAFKRGKGISKAADKLTKEEVEELDEISKKTLGSYIKKASGEAVQRAHAQVNAERGAEANPKVGVWKDMAKLHQDKKWKRMTGVRKATDKLTKEEAEQVDEAAAVSESLSEASTDKTLKVVKHNGKPIGEIGIDSEASPGNGPYYVKLYDGTVDEVGFDTPQEAMKELNYLVKQVVRYSDPAPFEGGRKVKSSKPAAERVKKIAKGMQKKYTKKD